VISSSQIMMTTTTTLVTVLRRKPSSIRCRQTTVRSTRTRSGGHTMGFSVGLNRPDSIGWPPPWYLAGDCHRSWISRKIRYWNIVVHVNVARLKCSAVARHRLTSGTGTDCSNFFMPLNFCVFGFFFLFSISALCSSCIL